MITPLIIYKNYKALLLFNSSLTSFNVLLFKLYINLRHSAPNAYPIRGTNIIIFLMPSATSGVWVEEPDLYPTDRLMAFKSGHFSIRNLLDYFYLQ